MLKPLEQFICDECGDVIKSPEEGYVEWVSTQNEDGKWVSHGFRIVHAYYASPRRHMDKEGCYRYGMSRGRMDTDLKSYLQYVHQEMFSLLDVGTVHDINGSTGCQITDFREYVDFFKRLTLPYYEEARLYIPQALADEFITDENEIYLYSETFLRKIVEEYSRY